jgi:hypothetical protein
LRRGNHANNKQIFIIPSTIFRIVSSVLIHQVWCVIIFNQGIDRIKWRMIEHHELRIIEILAWALAGIGVLATIPVVMNSTKRLKEMGGEGDAFFWMKSIGIVEKCGSGRNCTEQWGKGVGERHWWKYQNTTCETLQE